jgi:hypothetical protein
MRAGSPPGPPTGGGVVGAPERDVFVTKKTVESRLSNAYRKLGIRARGELAGALRVAAD